MGWFGYIYFTGGIMTLKAVDARRLVEYVCERTHSFFETELAIPHSHIEFNFSNVKD